MLKINLFLILACNVFVSQVQAQTIIEHIPSNTPNSRYEVHDNGTVTDTATGLVWQRCVLGRDWYGSNCIGNASTHNWQDALQAASDSTLAGYNDWRLPNVNELRSLVAMDRYQPAINEEIFPATSSSIFWSSSPALPASSRAVDFAFGYDTLGSRTITRYVRLVRDAQ